MQILVTKIKKTKKDPLSYLDTDKDDSKSKVKNFLDSKGRNSKSTSHAYSYALKHFHNFLDDKYGYPVTIGNIIDKIKDTKEFDLYIILNNFVTYLTSLPNKISNRTLDNYVAAVKSYLQFNDIDISTHKFKLRVVMPKQYHEDEQAIDHKEIREILKACNNPRLKAYLYTLASGGMRANEALGLRLKDINFSESPTRVHIRKENKTRRPRDIFISDEATKYLKQWIDWKYRKKRIGKKVLTPEQSDDDIVFTKVLKESIKPTMLYPKVNQEFHKVLKAVGLDEIKEDSNSNRRKITLNSFRRFVYSTISDYEPAFAEWVLGHNKSPYWTKKEEIKREKYVECMKYLTFLDYSVLEARGKNVESKVVEQNKEIQQLKQAYDEVADRLGLAEDRIAILKNNKDDLRKYIQKGSSHRINIANYKKEKRQKIN